MRHLRSCTMRLLTLALVAGACLAEDAAPTKFYKLDFVVKEVEGAKLLNARTYSVVVSTKSAAPFASVVIRTGSKVPVPTQSAAPSTYNYLDVGVNIDCHEVREMQNGLSLQVEAEISSVLQESAAPYATPPTVRQNKWSSTVIVPLKKPTMVFSSDDATSKHQMQLELTATPIA